MKKSFTLLLTLLLVSALVLTACGTENSSSSGSNDEKRVVKIGYLPITHAVPLYIEKELEDYKNFELELVKFGSWPELMDALNTGRIDGASVLVTLAMRAKEQGIDLKAVALGHRDGNVFVADPSIDTAQDLKGKNFAIPHKFSTHNVLLYQMLQQNQMAYEDVNVIELPPAEMPAALAEGRIAGYVVAEPFGAISVSLEKGKVLYQDQDVWENSIDCTLVLRNDFIQNEKEVAQEFVNYYVAAGEVAEAKDEHTHEMSSKYMNVEEEVLDLSFEWIAYDDLVIREEEYEALRASLMEMGLMDNPPSYTDFVDHSLLDEAM